MQKHIYSSLKIKQFAISWLIIEFIVNASSNKECNQ